MLSRFTPFQVWVAASFVWTTVFGIIAVGWWYGANGLDGIHQQALAALNTTIAQGGKSPEDIIATVDRISTVHRYRNLAYANALGWWFVAVIPPLVSYLAGRWLSRNFRPTPISNS